MKKHLLITATLAASVLAGCATQSSNTLQSFQAKDLNAQVKSGLLVQKTNTFLVLNDSSSSMGRTYQGASDLGGIKLDVEKNLLSRFNKTIPAIPLTSGLRSFGFGPCLEWSATRLNQPLQKYSAPGFEGAINTLNCASGGTPLADGVAATQQDLTGGNGNLALVVFSDGMDDFSAVPATEALKAQYGDKLCVYTVWVGNEEDTPGQENLAAMSEVAGCGFTTTAAAISNADGMADFVKNVFFKAGTPAPAVPDCSKLDDDKDGVNNCNDKCPTTLPGVEVSIYGCWILDVKFDNDKDVIKPQYFPKLDKAAESMKLFPDASFEIQGHTSKTGSYKHNQSLSERRAAAVKKYLTQRAHISKLTSHGYSWDRPVDSNDTEEGRANNRRVQLEVNGQAQEPLKK